MRPDVWSLPRVCVLRYRFFFWFYSTVTDCARGVGPWAAGALACPSMVEIGKSGNLAVRDQGSIAISAFPFSFWFLFRQAPGQALCAAHLPSEILPDHHAKKKHLENSEHRSASPHWDARIAGQTMIFQPTQLLLINTDLSSSLPPQQPESTMPRLGFLPVAMPCPSRCQSTGCRTQP